MRAGPRAEARVAADAWAIRSLGSRGCYSTELLIQTLIAGVMIGVLYALMALGITFIYSIVRMINWAMGEFYMLGSYIQYVVVAYALGRDLWWLAVLISTAGTFLIGYLLEPILIKPMHARADGAARRLRDGGDDRAAADAAQPRGRIGGPNQYRPESNLPIMWVGPLPMEGARVAASVCALVALALFCAGHVATPGSGSRCAPWRRTASAAQTSGVDVFRLDARRLRDRRRARRACGRAARAAVPGLSDQRRGHDR